MPGAYDAPLWLDEPEFEPMFGQLWPGPWPLGVVVVPGVVVVVPGVVVDDPPAAQAAPAPIAATTAASETR